MKVTVKHINELRRLAISPRAVWGMDSRFYLQQTHVIELAKHGHIIVDATSVSITDAGRELILITDSKVNRTEKQPYGEDDGKKTIPKVYLFKHFQWVDADKFNLDEPEESETVDERGARLSTLYGIEGTIR